MNAPEPEPEPGPGLVVGCGRSVLVAVALTLAGCAGVQGPPPAPPSGPPAALPWELPAGTYPSQRLLRLRYEGPEGEGSLRLVLRLAGPDRYRLTVADRLGRSLFTVDAADGAGWLLDHRERLACPLARGLRLDGLPLEPWSLEDLPALLLGRLPAAPARRPDRGRAPDPGREELSYRDAEGRRWTARLAGGEPATWTLWLEGEPAVWWRRAGGEALLSDRRRGLQMSWREVGAEALKEDLPTPEVPGGYLLTDCNTEAQGPRRPPGTRPRPPPSPSVREGGSAGSCPTDSGSGSGSGAFQGRQGHLTHPVPPSSI